MPPNAAGLDLDTKLCPRYEGPLMVAAYRFLRGNRNRRLLPHRQLAPVRELLLSLAEFARAASAFEDASDELRRSPWDDAADALDAAAEALRRVAS